MGRRGIQEVAHQCAQKAAYARKAIGKLQGYSLPFSGPTFNEFIVRGPINAVELLSRLAKEREIDGGIALSRFIPDRPNDFLVCVTEINSRGQIDALVEGLATISDQ
jgi:glycine dehydrogenase subunit 1